MVRLRGSGHPGGAAAAEATAAAGTRSRRNTSTVSNFYLVFLLLAFLCAVVHTDSTSTPMLIRKCCPPHQQFSTDLNDCVAYSNSPGPAPDTKTEPVSSLIQRSGDNFPWWMNNGTYVFDPVTGNRTNRPFLKDQHVAAVVGYGPKPPCEKRRAKYFTWDSRSRYTLLSNGTLLLKTDGQKPFNLSLIPDEYCVDRVGYPESVGEVHVFLTCPCNRIACVNKCCLRSQELKVEVYRKSLYPTCGKRRTGVDIWKPKFYDSNNTNEISEAKHVVLDTLFPECDADSDLVVLNSEVGSKSNRILVQLNGSAVMEGYGFGVAFPSTRWCADTSFVDNVWSVDNAIICMQMTVTARNTVTTTLYGSLFMVSSFFLLLTLVVYALLPDMRRSAHAKALLCHVAALLVGSLALGISQLRGSVDSRRECYTMAFLIQYVMLATFFWLNTVCFDVAWTFREILPTNVNSSREKKKFLYYSLYAWGCPAVISIITAVLEFAEDIPNTIIRPNFALSDCWFYQLPAQFAYFYGPIAALLLANIAMYSYTAAQLVRARRETALVDAVARADGDAGGHTSARSVLGNSRERFKLHLKLFLVMGSTWVMECVSAIVGQSDSIWYFSDAVNILRGVFVFIIFCCKRDVLRRLRERVRVRWPILAKIFKWKGKGKSGKSKVSSVDRGHLGPAAPAADGRRRSSSDTATSSSDATGCTSLPMSTIGST